MAQDTTQGATQDIEEQINALPPEMRDRLMERMASMDEEQRARTLAQVRGMFGSMSPEQRGHLEHARAQMQGREDGAPQVGAVAPDFDLAVLDGDGARVRLSDLRGRPVGLIFGSYT
jgi:hypothetical protein